MDAGDYDFTVKLTDNFLSNTYDASITVLQNNARPYFLTELGPFEFRQNAGRVEVQLPEIVDPNGDETSIQVDLQSIEHLELTLMPAVDALPGVLVF